MNMRLIMLVLVISQTLFNGIQSIVTDKQNIYKDT